MSRKGFGCDIAAGPQFGMSVGHDPDRIRSPIVCQPGVKAAALSSQ